MRDASPLRYPGGKWRIASFFERLLGQNALHRPQYVEPYAGGASLALSLLLREKVSEIHLNDLDPAIHAFWHSVVTRNRDFIELVSQVPVTPEEWVKQKATYAKGLAAGRFALGFATFFLNRTNHSGILNGGMIGGRMQNGPWKLNVRFNRTELRRRIQRIAKVKNRIHLHCEDAVQFLVNQRVPQKTLVYLDPPYYRPGRHLYFNDYKPSDHQAVSKCVWQLSCPWVVSYDDVAKIRELYKGAKSRRLVLLHTARSARNGKEVLFFSPHLRIPARIN
ncbi:MAG: DNA adenine methylase [Acidobacteria bacterium]|nr:DNA adenine methylase [Acidobacteriota bacterium]